MYINIGIHYRQNLYVFVLDDTQLLTESNHPCLFMLKKTINLSSRQIVYLITLFKPIFYFYLIGQQ